MGVVQEGITAKERNTNLRCMRKKKGKKCIKMGYKMPLNRIFFGYENLGTLWKK